MGPFSLFCCQRESLTARSSGCWTQKDVIHALRASFDGFILAHLLGFAKGFEFWRTSRMGVWHAWHSTPLPYGTLSKLRLGALRNSFGARATDFLATRHTNYKCMEVFSNP